MRTGSRSIDVVITNGGPGSGPHPGEGIPKRISPNWLKQKKGMLSSYAKDSPYLADAQKEVDEGEKELNRREAFEGFMKSQHGMIPNERPIKLGNETHQQGRAFVRKDPNGKISAMSEGDAWEHYKTQVK